MKAIIFLRANSRVFNVEHGHVGWGFEISPGTFYIGAIEDQHITQRWVEKSNNPYAPFGLGPKNGVYPGYDMFKIIEVSNPNVNYAIETQTAQMKLDYSALGNNCLDATYFILKAYGAVLPKPSDHWFPNDWFKYVQPDKPFVLMESKHQIDFTVYEHPNCEGDSQRFLSNNDTYSDNDIHIPGREIGDCVSSIVLRKGKLRIFEHQNFGGKYFDIVKPGYHYLGNYQFEDIMSSFQSWK